MIKFYSIIVLILIFRGLTYTQVSHLVINEVDYDEINTDSLEFVEIYNGSGSTISLAGKTLVFVNGNNNQTYLVVDLSPAGQLLNGQYLVVADSNTYVPPSALRINFTALNNNIQNGSPDGIALVDSVAHTLIDAFCYEGAMTTCNVAGIPGIVSLVEGTAYTTAADSNNVQASLNRFPNGADVNNASVDWTFLYQTTAGATNDVVPAPSAPVLVSPPNNATGQNVTLNLTWSASPNAVSYRVQVAADAGFTSIIVNDSMVGGTSKTISGLANNTQYWWRVNAKNYYGTSVYSSVFNFTTTVTGISKNGAEIPGKFMLYGNYPNPFNPVTNIRFDLPNHSEVSLQVYNIEGKLIDNLVKGVFEAGIYNISYDAGSLPSGIYFYKLTAGNYTQTRKMVLVK